MSNRVYVLGKKMAPANKEESENSVYWNIQNIVKKSSGSSISHDRLITEMGKVKRWSKKVMREQSVKIPGSTEWCHGWIAGALRNLFIRQV